MEYHSCLSTANSTGEDLGRRSDAGPSPAARPTRRTLNRLVWALGGLGLGYVAQGILEHDRLGEGLLLYAVAIPLFAVHLGRSRHGAECLPGDAPRQSPNHGLPGDADVPAAGIRSRLGWGIAAAGFILSLASLLLFVQELHTVAWLLYLTSLLLFVGGMWLVGPRTRGRASGRSEGQAQGKQALVPGAYWLVAILLLALFFRFFQFGSLPFGTWYDEAVAGIDARRILQDPSFRPVFWHSMNHPAHHLYLFALALKVLGDNIAALRVVSVVFGIGTVITAYLFGREHLGLRWGLLLGFLVATMRWDVNFSRIAMNGIDTPFFEFLTLYLALRVLRGRVLSWRLIAATGLSLGLGLCFYTGFRLFVVAFILMGLMLLWAMSRLSGGLVAPGRPGAYGGPGFRPLLRLGLFVAAVWLVVMPVALFSWQNAPVFWQRTQTVSVFTNRDDPNLVRAIAGNIQKHALMFNYRGDNNGRHNLPGAPTLDRLSAALFALGIGLAVVRRDRVSIFFLLLLPVGLAGGIFSLDFEAPQSLRSIAAMPAVIFFIGLSLDALWVELRWAARITRPRYSLVLVAMGLGIITVSNGVTYFGRQARDVAVWQAFSTTETMVGKQVAELGPEPIYYFSPLFFDHPCIRFHAPAQSPQSVRKVMSLPDPLPAREPADRSVVYFIHPDEAWVVDWARQLYPQAHFDSLPAESAYPIAVLMVRLEPNDVLSVQGLEVRSWAGDDEEAMPLSIGHALLVNEDWPQDAHLDLPFVVEWSGVLYAPEFGHYTLATEAPGRASLTLDGQDFEGVGEVTIAPLLAQGNHDLRLRAEGGQGRVRLAWRPPGEEMAPIPTGALYSFPVTGHGLLGEYYANPKWEGQPTLARVDPVLNAYFHVTPLPRPYSVEWTGALDVPYAGLYALGLRSVDAARLFLDDQLTVEALVPDQYTEHVITLEAGLHDLRISYQDQTERSRIHLYWTRPGGEMEIIPSPYLWPNADTARATVPVAETQLPSPAEMPPMELRWQATWGAPGDGPGEFVEPRDVAVIDNVVFVADTGNRRVQAWDRDGTYRQAWAGGQEPFEEPLALAGDPQGRLLVLDSLQGWIYRFDREGNALDRIAGPGIQAFHPRGMTALPDGAVVVADTGGARLAILDADGHLVGDLGTLGDAPGQFHEPTDVAMGQDGTYYVAEAHNQRMQRVDRRGGSLDSWNIPPSIAHDGPHLAWAPDSSLLVTAPGEGAILRYAPDGRLLDRWTQAGAVTIQQPVGIYADAVGTLYVTDTGTHQVYVFEMVQPPAPKGEED